MQFNIVKDESLERSVLASALVGEHALYEMSTMLTEGCFYNEKNRILFTELEPLPREGKEADITLLVSKLGDEWYSFITMLMTSVATATTIKRHCEELQSIEKAREVTKRAIEVLSRSNNITDYSEYSNWGIEHVAGAGDGKYSASSLNHISHHISEAVNEFKDIVDGKRKGLMTGIADIDSSSGGFRGGEYVVIAGRPSQGKSSLGLSIIKNMAMQGKRVGLFSLEMTATQNIFKLTSMMSGTDNSGVRSLPYGIFRGVEEAKKGHFEEFGANCNKLKEASIFINSSSYTTITDLENELRSFCNRNGLDAFVLDYIGLVGDSSSSGKKNFEKVADISHRIRSLIKSLEVVGIVLVQLNRDSHNKKPSMANLADSTQIERDAHYVYLIHQPDLEDKTKKVIICDKGRDGGEGNYPTHFCTSTTEFTSMTKDDGVRYMESLRGSNGNGNNANPTGEELAF